MTEPRDPYPAALAELLATEVATQGDAAAARVTSRAASYLESEVPADQAIGLAIACRLLNAADAKPAKVTLRDSDRADLDNHTDPHRKCREPAPSTR